MKSHALSVSLLAVLLSAASAKADLRPLTDVVVNGKNLVADPSGLTVYVYDEDRTGVSNCYDGCALAWPPVLEPAGAVLEAPLSAVIRRDGTRQIALSGKPLYTYAGDGGSGVASGDGLGGIWHVVAGQAGE